MTPGEPDKRNDGFVTLGGPQLVPHCPQFRLCVLDRLHPVTGYCVVREQPRCFMIPHVASYHVYCCRGQFESQFVRMAPPTR